MSETQEPEAERLRRHLRAMSAVNRQLFAQIEAGGGRPVDHGRTPDDLLAGGAGDAQVPALAVRRGTSGNRWLEELRLFGGGDQPYLVRTPGTGMFLIDGALRRQVKSGLLLGALSRLLGEPRETRASDLERWREGPPVEVLEGASGPAFVVVGGRRLPLRGLPLPHLVSNEEMLTFPEGAELNIAARAASRASRTRTVIAQEGPVRGTIAVAKRVARRLRNRSRRASR